MIIEINEQLRLRTLVRDEYSKALPWYQDLEIQYLVNGIKTPYDIRMIQTMYDYLTIHGELYFIEVKEDYRWISIGDVALVSNTSDDLPIAIGDKTYWGKGIGQLVLKTLIKRAKYLGRNNLKVGIYHYNKPSQKLFEKLGFKVKKTTKQSLQYVLDL